MNTRLLFTHALSPLHAGTGQGVGVIDLPIAREKATGIPYLPGSSVKGTLRDLCPADDEEAKEHKKRVYGPESTNADEYAGAVQFADQRLLLLPVRSLAGTFAWVTSPYLLKRFARDLKDAGAQGGNNLLASFDDNECLVIQDSSTAKCKLKVSVLNKVVLEDLNLTPKSDANADAWAQLIAKFVFPNDSDWQKTLGERFCLVPDDVLSFLLATATEITARIKLLEDTKTVQKGGLWYEEALPAETILYGLVLATPTPHAKKNGISEKEIFEVVQQSIQPVVQLGGKATVGRGLCHLTLSANTQVALPVGTRQPEAVAPTTAPVTPTASAQTPTATATPAPPVTASVTPPAATPSQNKPATPATPPKPKFSTPQIWGQKKK